MNDELRQKAEDLARVSAISPDAAYEALVDALRGEVEPLVSFRKPAWWKRLFWRILPLRYQMWRIRRIGEETDE